MESVREKQVPQSIGNLSYEIEQLEKAVENLSVNIATAVTPDEEKIGASATPVPPSVRCSLANNIDSLAFRVKSAYAKLESISRRLEI